MTVSEQLQSNSKIQTKTIFSKNFKNVHYVEVMVDIKIWC